MVSEISEAVNAMELKHLDYQKKEHERDAQLKLKELEKDCHAIETKGTGGVSYNSHDPSHREIYRL